MKPLKIIFGLCHLIALLGIGQFYVRFFSGEGVPVIGTASHLFFVCAGMLILPMILIYIVIFVTDKGLSGGKKLLYSLLVIIFNIFAMTVLYLTYVWPKGKPTPSRSRDIGEY